MERRCIAALCASLTADTPLLGVAAAAAVEPISVQLNTGNGMPIFAPSPSIDIEEARSLLKGNEDSQAPPVFAPSLPSILKRHPPC